MKSTLAPSGGLELSSMIRGRRFEALRRLSPLFYLCASVMVVSLSLGGGTKGGFLSDVILQLVSISLLLIATWRLLDAPLTREAKQTLWLCGALIAIPLMQLIPLPPWLWTALPYREPSVEAYTLLGRAIPWMPISVSPQLTWLSLLSLLPPVSLFIASLQLSYDERRAMVVVVIAFGVLSAFVGLLQVAQGEQSSLRFFEVTNATEAVGFFANRNHFAALNYCLMVLTIGWIASGVAAVQTRFTSVDDAARYDLSAVLPLLLSVTVFIVFLAAEFMARSRAGLGLTMLALVGVAALGYSNRKTGFGASLTKILLAAMAVVLTFSLQFALYRVLERIPDTLQDDRPVIARNTIEAANAYAPIGSGAGTFVPVYGMFEKPEDVRDTYVNHAHNDFLELWLETGIFGLAFLGVFALWLIRRSVDIWRSRAPDETELDWSIARSATIVAMLLLAHSLVDYPLRTSALMGLMAFACALMVAPVLPTARRQSEDLHRLRRQLASRKLALPAAVPVALPTPQIATIPSPLAEKKDDAPSPNQQRWGANIEWPREWVEPQHHKRREGEGSD